MGEPRTPAIRLSSRKDWDDEVRKTFIQLYVVEEKSLPQVMVRMEELLGFSATYDLDPSPSSPWPCVHILQKMTSSLQGATV